MNKYFDEVQWYSLPPFLSSIRPAHTSQRRNITERMRTSKIYEMSYGTRENESILRLWLQRRACVCVYAVHDCDVVAMCMKRFFLCSSRRHVHQQLIMRMCFCIIYSKINMVNVLRCILRVVQPVCCWLYALRMQNVWLAFCTVS